MRYKGHKMCKKCNTGLLLMVFLLAVLLVLPAAALAKAPVKKIDLAAGAKGDPQAQYGVHLNGQVYLTITNLGVHGTGYIGTTDCGGGVECPSCEFPAGSYVEYLHGASYWIGAVVNEDTLVSVGADGWIGVYELWPGDQLADTIQIRTDEPADPYYSPDAVSNLDYVCLFNDTVTNNVLTGIDEIDNRNHIPMDLYMQQNSYSWTDPSVGDFVLFECWLVNKGTLPLEELWVGLFMDTDVFMKLVNPNGYDDDVCGFLPGEEIAYMIDNNGDPNAEGQYNIASAPGAVGLKVHGSSPEYSRLNYNWWYSDDNPGLDWGPRLAGTPEDPFRFFGVTQGLGTPMGDLNKYYVLHHNEIDYDQLFTAVNHEAEGFLPPPDNTSHAENIANGVDSRYIVSFGPYNLNPNDTVHFFYSIVMGENVHTDGNAYTTIYNPADPQAYYDQLDFSDLVANAAVADSVYAAIIGGQTDADDGLGDATRPDQFMLKGNYPNPFNPATTIEYSLPNRSHVTLRVYNLLGQNIRTLVDGIKDPGTHTVVWDGRDNYGGKTPSGIYFYQIKSGDRVETRKMMLLK